MLATPPAWVGVIQAPEGVSAGRSYGGYGTTGGYGYGAWGHYGESQFGGGAEEERPARRRLTPEEYWQRYFAPASYEGRTRGDDTGDRFVPPARISPRAHPAVRDVDNRIEVHRP